MQIYAARPENGEWKLHTLTDWDQPVLFSGRGSMGFIGISISGLSQVEPDVLTMTYRHKDYGSGRLFIDEETLQPLSKDFHVAEEFPPTLDLVKSDFEGMQIRRRSDAGNSPDPDTRYILQWETLPRNYDRPRTPPLPEPSVLWLYEFRKTDL